MKQQTEECNSGSFDERCRAEGWSTEFAEQHYRALWDQRQYAAWVRSPDFRIVVPIVRQKSGACGFVVDLPREWRCEGLRFSSATDLSALLEEVREELVRYCRSRGISPFAVVEVRTSDDDHAPVRRPKVMSRLAYQPSSTMPDKRWINPWTLGKRRAAFCILDDWVARSPMTPAAQITYSRLLHPVAGEGGFCRRFDPKNGCIVGLDAGALARYLGRDHDRHVRRVLNSLANDGLIDITGGPGAKKDVRFLSHVWMPEAWRNAGSSPLNRQNVPPCAGQMSRRTSRPGQPDIMSDLGAAYSDIASADTEVERNVHEKNRTKNDSSHRAREESLAGLMSTMLATSENVSKQDNLGRFAMWFDKGTPPRWQDLCQWLGREEMCGPKPDGTEPCGKLWWKRFSDDPDLVSAALQQARTDEAVAGARAHNRAAVLTKIWTDRLRLW